MPVCFIRLKYYKYINRLITAFKKEFKIYKKYHNYRIVTRQYFPKGIKGSVKKTLAFLHPDFTISLTDLQSQKSSK